MKKLLMILGLVFPADLALAASYWYVNRSSAAFFVPVGIETDPVAGSTLAVNGVIQSLSGGVKFPDGTIQTTASVGGGGAGDDLGNHTATENIDVSGFSLLDVSSITVNDELNLGATDTAENPSLFIRGPNASVGDVRTGFLQMRDNGDTGNNLTMGCTQGAGGVNDDCNIRLSVSTASHLGINFGDTPSSAFAFNPDAILDASLWIRSRAAQTGSGPLQRMEMTQQTAGFTMQSRTGGIYLFPGTSAGNANVGIGTQAPTAKLHVVSGTTGNGTKPSDLYSPAQLAASTPTTQGVVVVDSNFDLWVGTNTSAANSWRKAGTGTGGAGDNLGDHTATEDVEVSGFSLLDVSSITSPAGSLNITGSVLIGTGPANTAYGIDMQKGTPAGSETQFTIHVGSADTGGYIQAFTHDPTGLYLGGGVSYVGTGSTWEAKATQIGLLQIRDGELHFASQYDTTPGDTYSLGSTQEWLSIDGEGFVVLGSTQPGSVDIQGGLNAGTGDVDLIGVEGKINGPLSSTILDDLSGENLLNISSVAVQSVYAAALASTDSPNDNDFPSYDAATGGVTWEAGAGGADNLGDHTATQSLDMAGFGVLNVTSVTLNGASAPVISSTYTGITIQLTDEIDDDFALFESSGYVNGEHITTASNAQTVTNKTFDASATGNVLKKSDYKVWEHPDFLLNTSAMSFNTSSGTYLFGQAVFDNATSSETNCAGYQWIVPMDLDTGAAMSVERFSFTLGNSDTGTHRYVAAYSQTAPSANPNVASPFTSSINLDFAGDASGASGDVEGINTTALTGWPAALTAGRHMIVWVCRDGDATEDGSTINSTSGPLIVKYGITQ